MVVRPLSPAAFVPPPPQARAHGQPPGIVPLAGSHSWSPQGVPMPGPGAQSHVHDSSPWLLPTLGPPSCSPTLVSTSVSPAWSSYQVPRLFRGPGLCGWSSHLGPQPHPRAGPQTVSTPCVLTAGPHTWSPSLVLIPVPIPVPISAPHMGRALQAESLGATGPPTLSQGHPKARHPYPGGITPTTAASPSHQGLGRLPQTPSRGQSLHSPRKSCPLPLHPFFSAPPVSNSFSSPVMRGLHGKLQQDAFVGRQSEWGRQFGALSAAAPPDPCWGDI